MYYRDVFLLKPKKTDVFEINFGYNFSKRYIEKNMECRINVITGMERIKDLNIKEKIAFFIFDPTCIPSIYIRNTLIDAIKSGYKIATCVTNETNNIIQQIQISFLYHNISTFNEVSKIIFNKGLEIVAVEKIDPFLFAVDINSIEPNIFIKDIPYLPISKGVVKNAFVHRFGDSLFSSPRDDLIPFVPDTCKKILDIGCARGGFGKNLQKKLGKVEIIGIEISPSLAEDAKKHYTRVIVGDVLNVEIEDRFDLIVCGDLIEHVYDPWKLFNKIHSWLKPDGYFLSCVPNIGHWSIVSDLLYGKFEYILVGLLCVGHIRFFTEKSLKEMLKLHGFKIDLFHKNIFEPTPKGKDFINKIKETSIGDIDSLNTFSFTFRAKKI